MNLYDFEPKIVAFCCHYCAYAAADLSGSMRLQYPPNIRIIRTPCTGKLEVEYFMRAFEKGADGVVLVTCHHGDCKFIEGNLRAQKRAEAVDALLDESGMGRGHMRMIQKNTENGVKQILKEIENFKTEIRKG